MNKTLELNNKIKIQLLIVTLFFLFCFTIIIPLIFIKYLSFSAIGYFFGQNILFGIFSGIFFCYIIFLGNYSYTIHIDPYVVKVSSFRPVFYFIKKKSYIDIPHSMLIDFKLFNRPFSFNNELILEIENTRGIKIAKHFSLTLISNKDIQDLNFALEKIIAKNR